MELRVGVLAEMEVLSGLPRIPPQGHNLGENNPLLDTVGVKSLFRTVLV